MAKVRVEASNGHDYVGIVVDDSGNEQALDYVNRSIVRRVPIKLKLANGTVVINDRHVVTVAAWHQETTDA